MDDLLRIHHATTANSIIVRRTAAEVSLRPDLLRQRVADLCLGVLAEAQTQVAQAQAQAAQEVAQAFAEIDCAIDEAFDKAFEGFKLRPGAPPEEVAAVVEQAAIIKEAVKESLWQRGANILERDRKVRSVRAEHAHRTRTEQPTLLTKPVRAVAWEGAELPEPHHERTVILTNTAV